MSRLSTRGFGGAFALTVIVALYGQQAEGETIRNPCQICDAKGACAPKCNPNCFTCEALTGACKPIGDPCLKCDPQSRARAPLG